MQAIQKSGEEELQVDTAGRRFAVMEFVWVMRPKILEKEPGVLRDELEKEIVETYRRYLPESVGDRCTSARITRIVSPFWGL
jgi:hypothetical protein